MSCLFHQAIIESKDPADNEIWLPPISNSLSTRDPPIPAHTPAQTSTSMLEHKLYWAMHQACCACVGLRHARPTAPGVSPPTNTPQTCSGLKTHQHHRQQHHPRQRDATAEADSVVEGHASTASLVHTPQPGAQSSCHASQTQLEKKKHCRQTAHHL